MALVLAQLRGLAIGYNENAGNSKQCRSENLTWTTKELPLTEEQIMLISANGDLGDIFTAVNEELPENLAVRSLGKCSALIKLLPDMSELFVSQDTWTEFSDMVSNGRCL